MPTAGTGVEPPRILVVDDDRQVTRILRSMLELDGYRVDEATGGAGLVDRIAAAPPALVLLDVYMPGTGGLEVLAELRRRLGTLVPVLMLSGESDSVEVAVEALREGALDYLVKPVSMERLLSTVRTTLALHALGAERDRLRLAVETAWDAVVLVDAGGRVMEANPAAQELLGPDVRGRTVAEAWPGPAAELVERARKDGGSTGRLERREAGGEPRWLAVRARRSGGPSGPSVVVLVARAEAAGAGAAPGARAARTPPLTGSGGPSTLGR